MLVFKVVNSAHKVDINWTERYLKQYGHFHPGTSKFLYFDLVPLHDSRFTCAGLWWSPSILPLSGTRFLAPSHSKLSSHTNSN